MGQYGEGVTCPGSGWVGGGTGWGYPGVPPPPFPFGRTNKVNLPFPSQAGSKHLPMRNFSVINVIAMVKSFSIIILYSDLSGSRGYLFCVEKFLGSCYCCIRGVLFLYPRISSFLCCLLPRGSSLVNELMNLCLLLFVN